MKWLDWHALVKNRHIISVAALLVLALAGLVLAYRLQYSPSFDLGAPGDSPFLRGFYADEPDIDYRYRWTQAHSELSLPGMGSAKPYKLSLRLQGLEIPTAGRQLTVTVALNGIRMPKNGLTGPENELWDLVSADLQTYDFMFEDAHSMGDISAPYMVSIDTGTYRPPGDARDLGLKVDDVVIGQYERNWNLPSLDVALWVMLTVFGVYLLFARLPALVTLLVGGGAGFALDVAAFLNPFYLDVYLPTVAIAMLVVGLVVWQKATLLGGLGWLNMEARRLSISVNASRRSSIAMLVALGLFAVLALWTTLQVVWIGHADYAENANVARSLVEGRGLTVDYVAQFYQDHPGITHPAETWPLLQPVLIAPFFELFGPQTWAAKLPNLVILLALAWSVFAVGSRLWDSRAGLIAGLLTLLHSYFFNSVLYPINDLAFTAIFFGLAWAVLGTKDERERTVESGRWTISTNYRGWVRAALVGALAGLLVWSKPSGAVLLIGVGLWVAWEWWRDRRYGRENRLPWRSLVVAGGAFGLVLLPLLVRNYMAFGSPFYSTEGYDAWILRYWPFYEWENIYKYYVGSELPHQRWVVGGKFGYANLFDAIGFHLRAVWDKGVMNDRSSEFVIGPWALQGALLGLLMVPRRAVRLVGMALFSITLYGIFVLLYWHFEGRYFQVAIPWLYLLLAGAVVWVGDVAGRLVRGVGGPVVSTLVVGLVCAGLVWPQAVSIGNALMFDTRPTSFTVAMDWLGKNSSGDDVVMTRDPWELNWYTRRKAVMIPFDDIDTILRVARQYGVTMLQLGGPTDGFDVGTCPANADAPRFPTGSRPALGKLYCGYELPGFTLVYKNGDLTIYHLTQ